MLRAVTRRSLSQPLPSARAQGFATFSPPANVANCEQRLSLVSSSLREASKLSSQLRARLRDAAEGPRSTMAAPRGYWLTAKGHCTSRQLVATRKGPAPMGILRTHNKPQLLRPHRQVFFHPPPWALCRRPTGMCFARVLRIDNVLECTGKLRGQGKLLLAFSAEETIISQAAKLIHFAKQ